MKPNYLVILPTNQHHRWGEGGGSLWQLKRGKMEDHGQKNFLFPNHENEQVRYSF